MKLLRMTPGKGDVLLAEGDREVAEDEERLVEEFRRQLDLGMWAAVRAIPPVMGAAFNRAHGDRSYEMPPLRMIQDSGIKWGFHTDTTEVKFEEMLHHTRAVARGVKRALLVGDLSIGTYGNPEEAVENAQRLVDAGAQAVKLEGGASHAAQIEAIVRAKIPLMAHIGMVPQSVREEGGYKVKGRSAAEAERLLQDARAVEAAGAFSVVLEIVAAETARQITDAIGIPTIGIGASATCDGQILVLEDMLGLSPRVPKFVKRYTDLGPSIGKAVADYAQEVRSRAFPTAEHVYPLKKTV